MDPTTMLNSMSAGSAGEDADLDDFLRKVQDVEAAIQAMKDGDVDPKDVRVEGIPTPEEEAAAAAAAAERRAALEAKKEAERRERKREEKERWWRHAECQFGDREERAAAIANPLAHSADEEFARTIDEAEELRRTAQRYEMNYSRWDSFVLDPDDPASIAEKAAQEAEDEAKRNEKFEAANPDFCKGVLEDMESRQKAQEQKAARAKRERLLGNRAFKARPCRAEDALWHYMEALRHTPFAVNVLTNCIQACMKLGQPEEAVEFCDRALHVDPRCIKARVRLSDAFAALGKLTEAATHAEMASRLAPKNVEVQRKADARAEEACELRLEDEVRRAATSVSLPFAPSEQRGPVAAAASAISNDASVEPMRPPGGRPSIESHQAFALHTVEQIIAKLKAEGITACIGANAATGSAAATLLPKGGLFVLDALAEMLLDSKQSRAQLRVTDGLAFLSSELRELVGNRGAENMDYVAVEKLCLALAAAILNERRSIQRVLEGAILVDLEAAFAHFAAQLDVEAGNASAGGSALPNSVGAASRLLGAVLDPEKSDGGLAQIARMPALLQNAARCLLHTSSRGAMGAVAALGSVFQDATFAMGEPTLRHAAKLRETLLGLQDPVVGVALAAALDQVLARAGGGDAGAVEALCGAIANLARLPQERGLLGRSHALFAVAPGVALLRVAAGGKLFQGPPKAATAQGRKRGAGMKVSPAARAHALAALLNGTTGAEGETLRVALFEAGGLLVALALLKGYDDGTDWLLWSRGAGLLGRLAALDAAAEMLAKPAMFEHLTHQIAMCAFGTSGEYEWEKAEAEPDQSVLLAGANHLVRALALALMHSQRQGECMEAGARLVPALVCLLPQPRVDPLESRISARTVALPPFTGKYAAPLVAHTCKSLSLVLGASGAALDFLEEGGMERIVCAFANYSADDVAEKSARRNAAILMAKVIQMYPKAKELARELRGLEMLTELGGRVV